MAESGKQRDLRDSEWEHKQSEWMDLLQTSKGEVPEQKGKCIATFFRLIIWKTNPFAEKTEEEKIKADMNNFRRSFLMTKEMCSLLTNTKRKLQKKQEKLKKAVDNLSKEVKLNNLSMIKDLDVAKHYMFDMAKENMRRRPSQNVKAQEESENKGN